MAGALKAGPRRDLLLGLAFLGSFLLFEIEVIVARLLLPYFGGAAYVWTSAMMFFQGMLLAGYAYCRGALSRWGPARYARLHLLVVLVPLAFFPLSVAIPRTGADPVVQLLCVLFLSIGAPFFALSTTSPILQSWDVLSGLDCREDSYSVYAASNLGALAALLSYPFLIEPALSLRTQFIAWQAAYAAYAGLHWLALPPKPSRAEAILSSALSPESDGSGALMWVLLSLGPSAFMLASTNLLTLDFAAVPLLWIAPLALYLATFVLNFKRSPWYPRRLSLVFVSLMLLWCACAVVTTMSPGGAVGQWEAIRRLWVVNKLLFILGALFIVCMISHRALAQSKPPAERSAGFYAWIALGGWLGSVLVAVLIPWLARASAMPELDWALAGGLSLTALVLKERGALARLLLNRRSLTEPASEGGPDPRARLAIAALCAVIVLGSVSFGFFINRSLFFSHRIVLSLRNFYGYYAVTEDEGLRKFFHGNTLHGLEYLDPAAKDTPLLYYHRKSPLGEVMSAFGGSAKSVGVVGLGVGVIAAYGRSGQSMDFYELDPDVSLIARNNFCFLKDSRARIRIIDGDGRISLAGAGGARYDLLVLDAFTSGAIPVHLLTEEALRLYLARMSEGGILAFHITNRFLNLRPILAAAARDLNLAIAGKTVNPGAPQDGLYFSSWVVLCRDRNRLKPLLSSGWEDISSLGERARPWTDQHASLWSALSL